MDKGSILVKKTAIYAIGNFGSKILAYVMVLVYSYYITADEMGYYDIILTSISMLQPLVLFQINDAVFRYLVDAKTDSRTAIIGTGFHFLCATTLLAEVALVVFSRFVEISYVAWCGGLFASTMFFVYLQDVIRGMGMSKIYAYIGILNSVIMLACEVIGLLVFKLGVLALIVSKVAANTCCIVIMMTQIKGQRAILCMRLRWEQLSLLLKYSAPLVPNAVSWWVVNSSSRYIILGFLGAAYNGIFSMASKFPSVLTTITSIFYLAWQESAIKEYDSPNRDSFFSSVFQKYYRLLFSLCLCAIPATRFVLELMVSAEYRGAWQYTGLLYLAAVLSALCSFLGMGYQISKETGRVLTTTLWAASINILVTLLLIKLIGLHAASLAAFASYLVLFWIRIWHTKRYFVLSVNWKEFLALLGSAFVMMTVVFLVPNAWACIGICCLAIVMLLVINKGLYRSLLNKLKH